MSFVCSLSLRADTHPPTHTYIDFENSCAFHVPKISDDKAKQPLSIHIINHLDFHLICELRV